MINNFPTVSNYWSFALPTSVDSTPIYTDKVAAPNQADTKSKKTCYCKCKSQNPDLKVKQTEIRAQEITPTSEVILKEQEKIEEKKTPQEPEETNTEETSQDEQKE